MPSGPGARELHVVRIVHQVLAAGRMSVLWCRQAATASGAVHVTLTEAKCLGLFIQCDAQRDNIASLFGSRGGHYSRRDLHANAR